MRENFKTSKAYHIFLNEGLHYGEGKSVKREGTLIPKKKPLDWEIFLALCLNQ